MLEVRILKVGTTLDRRWHLYSTRPLQGSLIAIPRTAAANQQREAYCQYFSKHAVRGVENLVNRKIGQFIDILAMSAKEHLSIDLSRAYRCLTADIIMFYAYREDFEGLVSPGFGIQSSKLGMNSPKVRSGLHTSEKLLPFLIKSRIFY